MKIGKQLYGHLVKLTWQGDPIKRRADRDKRLMGRAGLAKWVEYGVIDQVVEGVVHLIHSEAYPPGSGQWDEVEETLVPEDLVTDCIEYEPKITRGLVVPAGTQLA